MADTIVALATPLGRSGIGVIRLSGSDSLRITRILVGNQEFNPSNRVATLQKIIEPGSGVPTDDAVLSYFKAPKSFTGEDVIEISCHGSPVVLRQVLDQALSNGARLAGPGEFSLRAVANGRIDLSEAEAIRDLIDAQTMAAAKQSVRQMGGEVSHLLQPLKDDLLGAIVILESALEFVEDDLPDAQTESLISTLFKIRASVLDLASTFKAGRLIRDGIRIALVGRPNVGKSSIFNALLGSNRAIVTDIAGTTRDQLHERFTIGDIPISLIDTAGLRDTEDVIERIGVERSRRTMADADLILVVIDSSRAITDEDLSICRNVEDLPHLIVFNKIDKVDRSDPAIGDNLVLSINGSNANYHVSVSALSGEGLNELKEAIVEPFTSDESSGKGFLISDARHHDLLVRTANEIDESTGQLKDGNSEEIVLIGLHNALRFLGEITGETTTEDMLTRIFSTFCIGK